MKSARRNQIIESMKLVVTILLLCSWHGAFAQSTVEAKLTATLMQFHQDLVNKNTVSINQQTDKGLIYGHSNGWTETKNELIKNLETGYISYQSYKEDSLLLTVNENMANARFVADIAATLNGVSATYSLRVLEVWVRKGSRWILFARQAVKKL